MIQGIADLLRESLETAPLPDHRSTKGPIIANYIVSGTDGADFVSLSDIAHECERHWTDASIATMV
jgi:hypothetical protein